MRQVFAKCFSKIFVLANIFAKISPPPLKNFFAKICAVRQMSYAARKNGLFCKIFNISEKKVNGDFFAKM